MEGKFQFIYYSLSHVGEDCGYKAMSELKREARERVKGLLAKIDLIASETFVLETLA